MPEEIFATPLALNAHHPEALIKFVDQILQQALEKNASDIHIEPYAALCRIRYRQDGILYEITDVPAHLAIRLVTRIKVMANLDIAEQRLPQDGHFCVPYGLRIIDVRVNTCPTLYGEKIVLRLLDQEKTALDIPNLGLSASQQTIFLQKISTAQGMVLVTGPTGSGKTVTLYSALRHLNTAAKNISTVEDPVEIQLAGINQVNINPKIGWHFATVLRTFLRQDPDIIMVGEIRDADTANIAMQAAQTGHLVFSTIHANNTLETFARLKALEINPYHLVNTITLIVAQRLIRKLCPHCKELDVENVHLTVATPGMPQLDENSTNIIYRAVGCPQCLHGYLGRTGIYEILVMNETIAELLQSPAHLPQLTETLSQQGFTTLYQSGLAAVKAGITSFNEIQRVLGV